MSDSTRTVEMWLSNEESAYHAFTELLADALVGESLMIDVDNVARDWVRDEYVGELSGLAGDLVGHALAEVNWTALVNDWIDGDEDLKAAKAKLENDEDEDSE